jgi:hypothetical protein
MGMVIEHIRLEIKVYVVIVLMSPPNLNVTTGAATAHGAIVHVSNASIISLVLPSNLKNMIEPITIEDNTI